MTVNTRIIAQEFEVLAPETLGDAVDLLDRYGPEAKLLAGGTDLLLQIKARVESVAATRFNSVLINYYRDHNDSMGMHSDDEAELGRQPVIASLSLGGQRRFVLRHRHRKNIGSVKLELDSGSLLIMKGDTQANWKHGIPKQSKFCPPRLNLTFRMIKNSNTCW